MALAIALVTTTAGEICLGWSSNAAERAACCTRMANDCAAWSADDCCQEGEQRQTRELVRPVAPPARDMTVGPVVAPTVLVPDAIPGPAAPGERPAPHLLHSVFLI